MSQLLVKQALKAASLAALGSIPCAFENAPFTKPSNAKWAAWWFRPNRASVETLGIDGQDKIAGFVQVDVNYPLGGGDGEADADFQAIRDAFPAGSSYTADGQTVTVIGCGENFRRIADNMFRVSTTIAWEAMIER